ncbi:Spo0B domain-containing protein [Oceanobacillus limi]|uniref:Spo0B domain-containing protein n=1 Tax=Oceanobacillus limi TaxID=930131 RepID=UPI00147BA540|nr:Spo0B domain-containing protein [Oceanobacillus limi]
METKDVVELLRHQRHDLMNHMQIIQGYLSMGKTDMVHEKLDSLLNDFQNERKLMNLNVPYFTVWLIQFNSVNSNIRLAYDIHTDNLDIHSQDQKLVTVSESIAEAICDLGDELELYELTLKVLTGQQSNEFEVVYTIQGNGIDVDKFRSKLQNMIEVKIEVVESTRSEINCRVSFL